MALWHAFFFFWGEMSILSTPKELENIEAQPAANIFALGVRWLRQWGEAWWSCGSDGTSWWLFPWDVAAVACWDDESCFTVSPRCRIHLWSAASWTRSKGSFSPQRTWGRKSVQFPVAATVSVWHCWLCLPSLLWLHLVLPQRWPSTTVHRHPQQKSGGSKAWNPSWDVIQRTPTMQLMALIVEGGKTEGQTLGLWLPVERSGSAMVPCMLVTLKRVHSMDLATSDGLMGWSMTGSTRMGPWMDKEPWPGLMADYKRVCGSMDSVRLRSACRYSHPRSESSCWQIISTFCEYGHPPCCNFFIEYTVGVTSMFAFDIHLFAGGWAWIAGRALLSRAKSPPSIGCGVLLYCMHFVTVELSVIRCPQCFAK